MYCSNCGAEISENDAYCPYCNVMNVRAAEAQYMNKLEDIREDTKQLENVSEHQTRAGMRLAGKRAMIVLLITAAVILGFVILGHFLGNLSEAEDSNHVQKEAAFKNEYFPKLDELYARGDDEATADYMYEIEFEEGSSILYMWKHYDYMIYYEDYSFIRQIRYREIDKNFWKYDYADVLYAGIELIYDTRSPGDRKMSKEEKEKIYAFRKEAEEIFENCLSIDKSELDEIYNACVEDDSYLSFSNIREWANKTGGNKR